MNAEIVLYSRSHTRDYRWIFVPSNISESSILKLKELYDYFDDNKGFFKQEFPPLFCLFLKENWLLLTITKTRHEDTHGRSIYCMQGLSFSKNDSIDFFWFLPYFIERYKFYLDVWQYLDVHKLDQKEYAIGKINIIQSNILDGATENLAKLKYMLIAGHSKSDIDFYPKSIVDLLYTVFKRFNPYEFSLGDNGKVKKIFKDREIVTFKQDESYQDQYKPTPNDSGIRQVETTKAVQVEENLEFASKESNGLDKNESSDDLFEYCEIQIGQIKNNIIEFFQKTMRFFALDVSSISEKVCFVAINISTGETITSREIETKLLYKIDNNSSYINLKDVDNLKIASTHEIVVRKLLDMGWIHEKKEEAPWWNYKFKRQINNRLPI